MRTLARLTLAAIACALAGVTVAAAQPAPMGCSSTPSANATQTLRCPGELTIVAEGGAMFTLQSVDKTGSVNAVDLQSKALLIDAPKQQRNQDLEKPAGHGRSWPSIIGQDGRAARRREVAASA